MARIAGKRGLSNGILFDTAEIPAAGITSATFFNVRTRANGFHLTNMKVQGMLAAPESFTVRSIRVIVTPGGAVSIAGVAVASTALPLQLDVMKAIHGGALLLEIGSKPYIDFWPLWMFSGGNSFASTGGDAAAGVTPRSLGNGDPSTVINLRHPQKINTNEPFRVEIRWPVANAVSVAQTISVVLGGDYVRAVE